MYMDEQNSTDMDWVELLNDNELPNFYAELARMFGKKNAVAFGRRYQGTVIQVPKLDKPLANIRNKRIKEEYAQGRSYRELAIKYSLTERWVRNIIDEDPVASNQISLFDA